MQIKIQPQDEEEATLMLASNVRHLATADVPAPKVCSFKSHTALSPKLAFARFGSQKRCRSRCTGDYSVSDKYRTTHCKFACIPEHGPLEETIAYLLR